MKPQLIAALLALAGLAACDHPSPGFVKRSAEIAAERTKKAQAWQLAREQKLPPRERRGPIVWDARARAFTFEGRPLRAARLWTFDGSAEGFTAQGVRAIPVKPAGLWLKNLDGDPILRSPAGLDIDGARYGLVVVRLTRIRPGAAWAGELFYAAGAHGETQEAVAKPSAGGGDMGLRETTTLVYDMADPRAGDWAASRIRSLRFDTEDGPGGTFILRQVAVVENPGPGGLAVRITPGK